MSKFKVGDRVIAVKAPDGNKDLVGKTGTIKVFGVYDSLPYGVDFDDFTKGHECSGEARADHGWWCEAESLAPVGQKVVITTDGSETLARLYKGNKVTKAAKATLSAEDTFDFETGARIALDRLFGKEPAEAINVGGFMVGDLVTYEGHPGTVICLAAEGRPCIGVEFYEGYAGVGHQCGGVELLAGTPGKSDRCGWYDPKQLKHLNEKKEEDEMKKSKFFPVKDIKAGYLLKVKNDGKSIYMTVMHNDFDVLGCCAPEQEAFWPVSRWDDDLTNKDDRDTKVLAVYGRVANRFLLDCSPNHRKLLWERKDEPKKMTVAEVCEKLGYDIEIVKE